MSEIAAQRSKEVETKTLASNGSRSRNPRSASVSPQRIHNGVGLSVAPAGNQKSRSASQARVPISKVQVGTAPPPNLNCVKSRIGSMANVDTQKLDWSVGSRIGSLGNANHKPGGGDKKILTQKVEIKAQSRIGSLENATHKPGGGEIKVETRKLDFKNKAQSKVGSMDNVKHTAGGGNVQIFDQKYVTGGKRASSACSETSNEKRSLPQSPTPQGETA